MYKRKRTGQGSAYQSRTKYKRTYPYNPNQKIVPGYTRLSGYYGRYNRSSLMKSQAVVNELKFIDTTITSTQIASSGTKLPATVLTFLKIPVGTGPSERIGRQIRVKSVNAYLTITKAADLQATDVVRVLWILDTQANGSSPNVNEILASPNVNSFRNMANSKRFVILSDKEITITAQNKENTVYSAVDKQMNFFKNLNSVIEYDSTVTNGALTTIRSNNIFMLAFSKNDTAYIEGTVRIRYDD